MAAAAASAAEGGEQQAAELQQKLESMAQEHAVAIDAARQEAGGAAEVAARTELEESKASAAQAEGELQQRVVELEAGLVEKNAALESAQAAKTQTVSKAKGLIAKLNEEKAALTQSVQEKSGLLEQATTAQQKAEAELADLKSSEGQASESLASAKAELTGRVAELEANIADERRAGEERTAALSVAQDKAAALEAAKAVLEKERDVLRDAVAENERKVEAAQAAQEQAKRDVEGARKAQEEADTASGAADALRDRSRELEESLEKSNSTRMFAEVQSRKLQTVVESLTAEQTDLRNSVAAAKVALGERDTRIAAEGEVARALREKLAGLEETLSQIQQASNLRETQLEREVQARDAAIARKHEEMSSATGKLKKLHRAHVQAKEQHAERESVLQQNTLLVQEQTASSLRIESAKKEQQSSTKFEQLRTELDAARGSLASKEAEARQLKTQVAQLSNRSKDGTAKLEARLATLQTILDDKRDEQGMAVSEVQMEMKRQVGRVELELEDVKKTDKEIIARVRATQKEELGKAQKALFEEQQNTQGALDELTRERSANDSRAKTIEALRNEVAAAESQLDVGKAQIQQLSMMLAKSGGRR
jgi:chromosome segregation ATPase